MGLRRAILVTVLLAAVLDASGCFLKKRKPPLPPQAQAPAATPAPQPAAPAPAASEPNRPEPETAPPAETTAPPPEAVPKPNSKPKHTRAARKPAAPPAPAPEKSSKVVVEQGGARPPSGPQLSASLPGDAAIHQKLSTAQLLEATDYNLKSISRTLTADEQAMVQHIRSYMQQSRDASKDGDVERAYNLALKAHLLSDELVKRQ